MVRACWTIGAALWSTAWHGALLLQGPALRALTFYVLSCEHWWLRWELESLAFSGEVTEAHRQLLHASRQVATDFGRWPLLIVRNLIASLGSQVWGCVQVLCRALCASVHPRLRTHTRKRVSWLIRMPFHPHFYLASAAHGAPSFPFTPHHGICDLVCRSPVCSIPFPRPCKAGRCDPGCAAAGTAF